MQATKRDFCTKAFIPGEEYRRIVDLMPILCVDLLLQNSRGEYLLAKRSNEPLKDQWWLPGGRVYKGESLEEAAIRKMREELSLEPSLLTMVGYCEYFCKESPFGLATGHHAVAFVFTGLIPEGHISLDGQNSEWAFFQALPANLHIKSSVELWQGLVRT